MSKECKIERVEKIKRKAPAIKKGFAANRYSLTKKEAIREAQRCLGLRECESCEACSLLCPDLCITTEEGTGKVLIDLDYCKGCGICAFVCPKGAIQMTLEDNISD
jgi:2-oxoacid:acceptor oxidoreductase delta subunit (pyruvate/2-ketoisovalerate family)